MRRAFSEALLRLAHEDSRVIFLTGDLGYGVFDAFTAKYPDRYINAGVAEAQLVDCAAGLALEGWRPVVYSIASFITGRAFEQIRVAVGYHGLPVIVVGAGGGYTYASSGVTHHAREDLALMSLIPGMTVVCPGDPNEVTELLPQLSRLNGPGYIRIGRFGEPTFESSAPIRLGRARLLRQGERIAILTVGSAAPDALDAADRLARAGVRPSVCHFHTLRPFDTQSLEALARTAEVFVVVEEHAPQGGLAAAVSHWCACRRRGPCLIRLGADEDLVIGMARQEEVRRRLGFDSEAIISVCLDL